VDQLVVDACDLVLGDLHGRVPDTQPVPELGVELGEERLVEVLQSRTVEEALEGGAVDATQNGGGGAEEGEEVAAPDQLGVLSAG
jgi:hypothetical protein